MSRFTELFQSNQLESIDSVQSESISDVKVEKTESKEKKIVTKWKSRKK